MTRAILCGISIFSHEITQTKICTCRAQAAKSRMAQIHVQLAS